MDEVEKFRFSRQQLKKELESIVRDIDKFWEENDLENYKVEVSIAEGIISDLEAINDSIYNSVDTEKELEIELVEKKDLRRKRCNIASKLDRLSRKEETVKSKDIRVRLPVLQISTFAGDYEEFAGWWEQFDSAVISTQLF